MRDLSRAAALALALYAQGCATDGFSWREARYELPEEALVMQRRELEACVLETAKASPALGGRGLVLLPTRGRLQVALFGGRAGDEGGRQAFELALHVNDLKAAAEALERSGTFAAVRREASSAPLEAIESYEGLDWLVIAAPDDEGREVDWLVRSQRTGRLVEVEYRAPLRAPVPFDAFIAAIGAAGREAEGAATAAWGRTPGWSPVLIDGATGQAQAAFPAAPTLSEARQDGPQRTWLRELELESLTLSLLATEGAPSEDIAAREQALCEELGATAQASAEAGEGERLTLLEGREDGRLSAVRILARGRWLLSLRVTGPRAEVLEAGSEPWEARLRPVARAFLGSGAIRERD